MSHDLEFLSKFDWHYSLSLLNVNSFTDTATEHFHAWSCTFFPLISVKFGLFKMRSNKGQNWLLCGHFMSSFFIMVFHGQILFIAFNISFLMIALCIWLRKRYISYSRSCSVSFHLENSKFHLIPGSPSLSDTSKDWMWMQQFLSIPPLFLFHFQAAWIH